MKVSISNSDYRLQTMLEKLRSRDYRITPQRIAIMKILASSSQHPSVENIYNQIRPDFPTMSLATVYKTILTLKEIGEVMELEFSNDRNRYDGFLPEPHPHLICTQCKTIIDPELNPIEDITLELAEKTGYEITGHRLDFYGLCPSCQHNA